MYIAAQPGMSIVSSFSPILRAVVYYEMLKSFEEVVILLIHGVKGAVTEKKNTDNPCLQTMSGISFCPHGKRPQSVQAGFSIRVLFVCRLLHHYIRQQ